MSNKKFCIAGSGGFGREVLTVLIDYLSSTKQSIEGSVVFMVDDESSEGAEIMGVPVIRDSDFNVNEYKVVVAIGNPNVRKKVVEKLPPNTEYATIIHPSAVISKWVEIGEGSIVTAGVVLTCSIRIGKHAHLNLHSTVGHDCVIGDYFTTAPASNISGNCIIGDCVYFGTNSSVRQSVNICDDVTIGMGGVVVKDIIEKGIYVGSPAKKMKKK